MYIQEDIKFENDIQENFIFFGIIKINIGQWEKVGQIPQKKRKKKRKKKVGQSQWSKQFWGTVWPFSVESSWWLFWVFDQRLRPSSAWRLLSWSQIRIMEVHNSKQKWKIIIIKKNVCSNEMHVYIFVFGKRIKI